MPHWYVSYELRENLFIEGSYMYRKINTGNIADRIANVLELG